MHTFVYYVYIWALSKQAIINNKQMNKKRFEKALRERKRPEEG